MRGRTAPCESHAGGAGVSHGKAHAGVLHALLLYERLPLLPTGLVHAKELWMSRARARARQVLAAPASPTGSRDQSFAVWALGNTVRARPLLSPSAPPTPRVQGPGTIHSFNRSLCRRPSWQAEPLEAA